MTTENGEAKLSPISGYWLLFNEDERRGVEEFCECLVEVGFTSSGDKVCDAARLLVAKRNNGKEL